MDTAQAVIDDFTGMSFVDMLCALLERCTYVSPDTIPFLRTLEYIESIHRAAGIEFSRQQYWNDEVIAGSHPVFPTELTSLLSGVPEELTIDNVDRMIRIVSAAELGEQNLRREYELARSSRRSSTTGTIDPGLLDRSISAAPVFVNVSADDETDDFL